MKYICVFLISLLVVSCAGKGDTLPAGGNVSVETEKQDITAEAWRWADSLASAMTEDQCIGQLFMPAVYARADAGSMRKVCHYAGDLGVGGIILLKGDLESTAEIADTLAALTGAPAGGPGTFVAIDAETGLGMRLEDAPMFPWNSRLNPKAGEQTFYDYGREVARECGLAGVNMVLGPVIDVDRGGTGRRGAMWLRSLGADPERVAVMSVAYARGLESGGVVSVAKHFPGHGSTTVDTHRGMASISTTGEDLRRIDLYPFRLYVERGLSGVIVGHLWVEAVDSVKRPASFSPLVIEGLLRREMNFEGLVLTDALNMEGACGFTAADALNAGADIVLAPAHTEREMRMVAEAVKTGKLSSSRVKQACRRVLFYKYLFGLPFRTRHGAGMSPARLREEVEQGSGALMPLLDGRPAVR